MASVVKFMRPSLHQELADLERELLGLEKSLFCQYASEWHTKEYYNRRKPILQNQIRAIREAMKGE